MLENSYENRQITIYFVPVSYFVDFSAFHNDPSGYAMDRYMYVLCYRCNKAYFGGESRCQEVRHFCVSIYISHVCLCMTTL